MKRAIHTFLLLLIGIPLFSQSKLISLIEVINHYQKKEHVTFLFDHDLVQGINVSIDTTNTNFEEAVQQLNNTTAFEIENVNSNVLIKPRKAGANLKLCGVVLDSEEHLPLPGVSIFDKKRTIGTSTDADGKFEILTKLDPDNIVTLRMVGYGLQDFNLDDFNKGCVTISLKPDIKLLSDVVVNAYMSSGIDYSFLDNSIQVRPNGKGLLPGETDSDLLMAIDALPGITTPDSKAGNLIIRGASPDQSLITFDDIPIYHKGHYFGTFSPYNPSVVENVKVFRSAYSADKGGRVGGVIEIKSNSRIPDSTNFNVGFNTTYGSGFTNIKLNDKISLMMAGRFSYPASWNSPKLNAINDFIYRESAVFKTEVDPNFILNNREYHFYDVNSKLIFQPSLNEQFSASFLGIDNRINLEIENKNNNSISYNRMHLKNLGYNLQWNKKWSERFSSHVSATQSSYSQSYPSKVIVLPDSVSKDSFFENTVGDYSLKLVGEWQLNKLNAITTGYDLQHTDLKYSDISLDSSAIQSKTSSLHSYHLTYKLSNPSRYILTLGLRNNYYSLANDFKIEPRFMFNYFLNDKWALKTSAGKFHQYLVQISGFAIESVGGIENLVWQLSDKDQVPIVESIQFMAGTMFHSNSWLIDLELYHNKIKNIAINDINDFTPGSYFYGEEWIYGGDLLVKKEWEKVSAWFSYTLSHAQMHFDSVKRETFEFLYNQNNVFDIVVEYKLKQFKIAAGWKYRNGMPTLNGIRNKYLHGAESSGGTNTPPPPPPGAPPPPPPPPPGTISPDSPEYYTDQFPSYHQLDISMVYAFPKNRKGWNGTIGLSLLNVYNRKNIIEQLRRPSRTGDVVVYKYSLGFAPNLTVSIKW